MPEQQSLMFMPIVPHYKSGIYVITNLASGKPYIGSAVNLRARNAGHVWHLRKGSHRNKHLQSAFNKYGAELFSFRPLLYCEPSHLLFYEQRAIDAALKAGPIYNINPTAGSRLGRKASDETKARMSVALKGHRGPVGHIKSPETREKLRLANLGKTHSPETRAKLSAAGKGRKQRPETIVKRAKSLTGIVKSQEAKQKISLALQGHPTSVETRAKIGASSRGRFVSEETKAKVSAASKRSWASKKEQGLVTKVSPEAVRERSRRAYQRSVSGPERERVLQAKRETQRRYMERQGPEKMRAYRQNWEQEKRKKAA